MTAVSCTLYISTLSVQSYCCESRSVCGSVPLCPTNDSLGTTWKRAQEMARKFLMFNFEFVLLCWVQVWVALCRTQLVRGSSAMDTGHSWAYQWSWATSGEGSARKGKCCMTERSEEEGETALSAPRSDKEREELLQVPEQVCSLQTTEDHVTDQVQIFLKELQSMERSQARTSFCWRTAACGENHDGATERSCYRLPAIPIFLFALCCLGWGETEKLGVQSVKLSLRKEGNNVLF